ncbi:DICT sensory domain-containing protein [Salinilacihabitans rarus]|uniref:DICT sensory domain-containing protein n=1 Tax=Salinilacihabitans rarus TaxID=2961596 RepID=UPI0020C8AECC|nr:DICT sensory domain-containing protein [Salinilacihabitans rarus]
MSFREFLDRVERRRLDLTVYAPEHDYDVVEQFDSRNVSVDHRSLPAYSSQGFLVLRRDGEFVASVGLAEVREFLEPPVYRPWTDELVDAEYRTILGVLDNTLWRSLDRQQLLATTREIENRAWRVGWGRLRAGFQRLSTFRTQLPVYERLGAETDLEIHVYGRPDREPSDAEHVTLHPVTDGEIGDYWFLTFDGGDDELQACALLAEEREPGQFVGFWTYDVDTVAELAAYVRETYG